MSDGSGGSVVHDRCADPMWRRGKERRSAIIPKITAVVIAMSAAGFDRIGSKASFAVARYRADRCSRGRETAWSVAAAIPNIAGGSEHFIWATPPDIRSTWPRSIERMP